MSDALPCSAAAERNKGPILEVLRRVLPSRGEVLEIASGTGQHVVHFAAALPLLSWQPSDPDPERCATIAARLAGAALGNVRAPLALDVHSRDWPLPAPAHAIVCINMIHIAPWSATTALFGGAGRALEPAGRGVLLLYGPFRQGGAHTAASNAAFDASLRAENPEWGVRDLEAVTQAAAAHGFTRGVVVPMPANNLCVAFDRDVPGARRDAR